MNDHGRDEMSDEIQTHFEAAGFAGFPTIAEFKQRWEDQRQATIEAETVRCREASTWGERITAYWHGRILIAEDRKEPLYISEGEKGHLYGEFEGGPEGVSFGAEGVTARPVFVDNEKASVQRERIGDMPAKDR